MYNKTDNSRYIDQVSVEGSIVHFDIKVSTQAHTAVSIVLYKVTLLKVLYLIFMNACLHALLRLNSWCLFYIFGMENQLPGTGFIKKKTFLDP